MSSNGAMVVCLACKKMVWAYDADLRDVSGLLNMMKMPCRLCGAQGNYDGWIIDALTLSHLDVPDAWAAMHQFAEVNGFEWANSSDGRWFSSPRDIARALAEAAS